jgi:hypothetical protein
MVLGCPHIITSQAIFLTGHMVFISVRNVARRSFNQEIDRLYKEEMGY